MTFVPPRRQHARFICNLPLQVIGTGQKTPMEGAMLNIGMGGAHIRVKGVLKLSHVTLRVTAGSDAYALVVRVLRGSGIDPKDPRSTYYGIEFARDSATQGRLRLLLDRARGPGSMGGAPQSMRDYWR